MADLVRWKDRPGRKPLIIQGARQIGKTWIMQKFGQEQFDHVAYFNFDASEELCKEFENTKSPERLLGILRLYTGQPIEPWRTLIVFDEIQQSNKALNSLKYFCEEAPEYHIIAAGSLLGVSLAHGDSFPVGKVEFLQMYPITFREFLRADTPKMYAYLENLTETAPLPEIVMGRVEEAYRSVSGVRRHARRSDGHAGKTRHTRDRGHTAGHTHGIRPGLCQACPGQGHTAHHGHRRSIPSQLSRENRKFVYKLVRDGARAREYEDALLWLEHAGLLHRIFCASKPGLPLGAYDDLSAFKIYLCDTGLLRAMAQLPADVFRADNPLFTEFKGAMAENAVLQSMVAYFDVLPRYWTSGATAEVDFLLQNGTSLLPIEVKSGKRLSGKSLGVYIERFSAALAIRYSMNNLRRDGAILNIPIFLADWTRRIVEIEESRARQEP